MTSGHPALSISIATSPDEPPAARLSVQLERLQEAIDHAAHLLPSQGPITVFVHHNTLHALEDLPFSQAVAEGSRTFGCEPFYSKEYYRKQLKSGRIRISDLEAVLRQDLEDRGSERLDTLGTRFDLYLAMVRFPLQMAPTPELEWMIAETDALRRFRRDVTPAIRGQMVEDTRHWVMRNLLKSSPQAGAAPSGNGKDQGQLQSFIRQLSAEFGGQPAELWNNDQWEAFCLTALWNICLRGMEGFPPQVPRHTQPLVRHRDWLFKVTGKDSDLRVNDILIRFTAAFLDQGLAHWELPHRELGLYQAFLRLFSTSGLAPDGDLRGLRGELQRLLRNEVSPLECIQQTLRDLGVGPDELDEYLLQTLLTLRGWAGMIWQIETRTDRVVRPAPQGTLVEFLAVRLLLERTVIGNMARDELGWQGPLSAFRGDAAKVSSQPREEELEELEDLDQRAFYVFQLAQVMGWSPRTLYELPRSSWGTLLEELHSFNNFERRRIWQLAYERRYRTEALDALSLHAARDHFPRTPVRAQVVCCIDDREESFRRHLEEVAPDIETLSAAGFFAVAMYYQGAADAHYTPLCPIIVRPQHWVAEDVVFSLETSHQMRRRARRAVGRATHQVHLGSRSFAIGAVLATILGPLASVPMVARILFPRHTARLREAAEQLVEVPRVTQLRLERSRPDPSQEEGHIGYTVPEMTNIVERLLRDLGLTSNFAPLVLIVGHGSSSLNNPHESAYNCGACAGSRGGPNARAFAQMANDARVRGRLRERGLEIPRRPCLWGVFITRAMTTWSTSTWTGCRRPIVSSSWSFARRLTKRGSAMRWSGVADLRALRWTSLRSRPCCTWKRGRKTWPRPGRSTTTPRMPSASWAAASGRAVCLWTGGLS